MRDVDKTTKRSVAAGALVILAAALVLWLAFALRSDDDEMQFALDPAQKTPADRTSPRDLMPRASSLPTQSPAAESPTTGPSESAPAPVFSIDGLLSYAGVAPTPSPRVELIREEPAPHPNDVSTWIIRTFEERTPQAVAASLADGRFEFTNLSAGSYSVRAFGESLTPAFSRVLTLDDANPTASVTLRLEAGRTVRGVILNEKGEGIPNAFVTMIPAQNNSEEVPRAVRVVSAADGSFAAPAPNLRAVTLQVSASGFAAASKTFTPSDRPIEMVLRRGTAFTGRVFRKDGGPVEGAIVILIGRSSDWYGFLHAKTGIDGSYRIDGVPLPKGRPNDGVPMLMKVRARGLWILEPEESYAGDTLEVPRPDTVVDEVRIDLIMREARRVTGRVLDFEAKKPLAGVTIEGNPETVLDRSVVTDSDGRFTVGVLAESGRLIPLLAHFEPCDEFGGPPPGTPASETLELWMRPKFEVRGVVVSESGEPIAGALVTRSEFELYDLSQGSKQRDTAETATTDRNGSFTMTDVPRLFTSRYVAVHRDFPGGADVFLRPDADIGQDVRLVMKVGATVRGRVQFPNSAAAPGFRVKAYASLSNKGGAKAPTDPLKEATTEADGSFVFRGLPGDVVHLGVTSDRDDFGYPGTTTVNLTPAQPSDLIVLRLIKLETISGDAVDELGRPVVGAAVFVFPSPSTPEAVCDPEIDDSRIRAYTNEAGRFEVRGLDPDAPVNLRIGHWSSKDRSVRVLRGGAADDVRPGTRVLTITLK